MPMASLDEPVFSPDGPSVRRPGAGGDAGATASSTTSSTRSLRDRRKSPGASLGLDMGAITSSSREDTSKSAATAVFRGWSPTSAAPPGGVSALLDPMHGDPRALRILSYNILAARYTTTDKYVQCPVWALAEPYRLNNIVSEIRGADPDIVVLEECSAAALKMAAFGGALETMGYAWFHVPITSDKKERLTSNSQGSGNWAPSEHPDHEGVAILWRSSRFVAEEQYPLRYNALAQRDASLPPEEKKRVMVNSHNVAAVVALRDTVSEGYLIVGGLHCFWDSAKPECQLYQVARLLEQMQQMADAYADLGETACFVAGDFNAEHRSPSIQFVLNGVVDRGGVDPGRGFAATLEARHAMQLRSAYEEYVNRHGHGSGRHVTAVGGGYDGVIDHIFYQPGAFQCLAVAKLAPPADIPNTAVPSDHYLVSAWFVPVSAA